jgi:hypothetical protein
VATWTHLIAALIGGAKPWATIWVLMFMIGAAFLAAGYVLLRTAENPVRAVLIWVANPLLIVELVMGGHLDALVALFAIVAIVMSRRNTSVRGDLLVGVLVGVAVGIKVNAIFVALGIAIPLLHGRAWVRLARIGSVAAATTLGLYYFSYGFDALKPLGQASSMVISPTVWPWALPWYASIAWVALALLPRNSLTRWLTLATGVLSLLHFNGGTPTNVTVPSP